MARTQKDIAKSKEHGRTLEEAEQLLEQGNTLEMMLAEKH